MTSSTIVVSGDTQDDLATGLLKHLSEEVVQAELAQGEITMFNIEYEGDVIKVIPVQFDEERGTILVFDPDGEEETVDFLSVPIIARGEFPRVKPSATDTINLLTQMLAEAQDRGDYYKKAYEDELAAHEVTAKSLALNRKLGFEAVKRLEPIFGKHATVFKLIETVEKNVFAKKPVGKATPHKGADAVEIKQPPLDSSSTTSDPPATPNRNDPSAPKVVENVAEPAPSTEKPKAKPRTFAELSALAQKEVKSSAFPSLAALKPVSVTPTINDLQVTRHEAIDAIVMLLDRFESGNFRTTFLNFATLAEGELAWTNTSSAAILNAAKNGVHPPPDWVNLAKLFIMAIHCVRTGAEFPKE